VCAAPYMASSAEELISNADLAVYSAKRSGKNAVLMYSEDVEKDRDAQQGRGNGKGSYYDTYASTVYALTAAIDTKDHYTFSHSRNVAYYAAELARCYGLNQECIDTVREAGLLHDIGKIGIREDILNKPGRLTEEEYDIMKTHVENSIGIIRHLPSLDYVIPAVLSHHERYDGNGYPRGIAGEDIPLMGRILCVVDSFDAMVSRRSYKRPMSVEEAMNVLEKQKGRQFDPKLVEIFVDMIKNNRIELKLPEALEES
ncbi:MAG: HD domain-containing protein, partial [Candidatus Choladocola sp.]|nr:HD domain-containing protein [Candidatus Choladocola sp.]